jgi:hypothetical protein
MSEREYDGPALDVSWNDPPWAGDGETVDVFTDGGGGDVSTEGVDQATEELSDKELVRTIRELRHEGATYEQIREELSVGSGTIADAALGNGKYSGIEVGVEPLERGTRGRPTKLEKSDVKELRELLLSGESVRGLVDKYGVDKTTLGEYAKGKRSINPDQPPELEYSRSDGWVPKTPDKMEPEPSPDVEPEPSDEPNPHEPAAEYAEPPNDRADTGTRFVVGVVVGLAIAKIIRWLINLFGGKGAMDDE